jgi:zinc/manganese transport system permease protein
VLKEDASLAAFYLISLALGVTLVSLRGSAVDLFHVLFGNVLALDDEVLLLLASVASITLATLALVYRPLVMECVDPGFLRSVSRSGGFVHLTFLGLVVLNLVAGFHALGTLLAVGLMMLPAAAARFWTADITRLILTACGFGMLSGYAGLVASYAAGSNLPAGPAVILAAGALYLGSLLFGSQGGLVRRLLPRAHLQH